MSVVLRSHETHAITPESRESRGKRGVPSATAQFPGGHRESMHPTTEMFLVSGRARLLRHCTHIPKRMIVTTAELYKVAYGKFAVGAYNINNAEQTMGLFRGCIDSEAPFIIQISK